MGQGNYDHPSYITRQQINLGNTTAGNGTVGIRFSPLSNLRVRNVSATVMTAGTSAGHILTIKNGTTSVGSITLSTNTAGFVGTSGDLNTTVTAGTVLSVTNGTDATGVASVAAEAYLDPQATWTGQE